MRWQGLVSTEEMKEEMNEQNLSRKINCEVKDVKTGQHYN